MLHERLWVIKYTLFMGILGLSFYSMRLALILAEAEPFKTAISMRFLRAWPFVLFALAILAAGLFIERFYCRYLCPLGAALAIPAKLKIFDWLRRRPQCGRECRLCETKCTVGAIDPLGRINPNECVLCLRCQVIYHDPATCTVLKARANRAARAPSQGTPHDALAPTLAADRRRAAARGSPRPPERLEWRGDAFGGEARILLEGQRDAAEAALAEVAAEIDRLEAIFSLHRPDLAAEPPQPRRPVDRPARVLRDTLCQGARLDRPHRGRL